MSKRKETVDEETTFKTLRKDFLKEIKEKNPATGKEEMVKAVISDLIFPKRYRVTRKIIQESRRIIDGEVTDDFWEDKPILKEVDRVFTKIKPLRKDELESNAKKFKALLKGFESSEEFYRALVNIKITKDDLGNSWVAIITQLRKALSYKLGYRKTLNYNIYGDYGYLQSILHEHFNPTSDDDKVERMIVVKGFEAKALQSKAKRKKYKALRDAMRPDPKEMEHRILIKESLVNNFIFVNNVTLTKGLVPVAFTKTEIGTWDIQKEKVSLAQVATRYYGPLTFYAYKNQGGEYVLSAFKGEREARNEMESNRKRLARTNEILTIVKKDDKGKRVVSKVKQEIKPNYLLDEVNRFEGNVLIKTKKDMKIFKELIALRKFAELRLEPKTDVDKACRSYEIEHLIKAYKLQRRDRK